VKIGETLSDTHIMNIGVPQGGVLSAIFFLIYINDLHYLPTRANILGYADDTSLFYSEETPAEIEKAFTHDMEIILPWFRENLLHLDLEKYCFLVYSLKTSNGVYKTKYAEAYYP